MNAAKRKKLNLPTEADRNFYRAVVGEPTNKQRAEWAERVIWQFVQIAGDADEKDEVNATDLIADIFHWLHQRGTSP